MPKMKAFDVIKVHVHDDGDIELEKHILTGTLKSTYPSDILYGITEIAKGALDKELLGYGCDANRAKEAIDEIINSEYHSTINV